jgi:hypothetical protein
MQALLAFRMPACDVKILSEPVFVNLLMSPGNDSQPDGIDSSESIPGIHKRLQIRVVTNGREGEDFATLSVHFRWLKMEQFYSRKQ